jgi:hypothetical protein
MPTSYVSTAGAGKIESPIVGPAGLAVAGLSGLRAPGGRERSWRLRRAIPPASLDRPQLRPPFSLRDPVGSAG